MIPCYEQHISERLRRFDETQNRNCNAEVFLTKLKPTCLLYDLYEKCPGGLIL